MAEPVIRAQDVVAVRGEVTALRGVDFEIVEHEVVAVVGPSGSGKTTLLRCLAGLDRPTTGSLRSFGVDLHDATRRALADYRARAVGIVQQHYTRALSPDLRVQDVVGLTPALLGWPAAARRARVQTLLERVGLADRASARRTELSGGEQQRVAVCAALAARPRLLLADEPTGELDASTSAALIALVRALARP